MKWFFYLFTIVMLITIEDKVSKILKCVKNNGLDDDKKRIKDRDFELSIEEYIGKKVMLNIVEDGEIYDTQSGVFITNDIEGIIINYDSEWLVFKYYSKKKKKDICRYIRINDIESIDVIENGE